MKSVTNQSLEGYIMIIEPMIVTDKIESKNSDINRN